MAVFKNKRNGRWVAQVWVTSDGKLKQLGTRDTKREADALVREWHNEQALLAEQGDLGPTIAEWVDMWSNLKRDWAPATRAHNLERVKAFVAEYGDVYLADFNMGLARRWAREKPHTVGALSAMFGAALGEVDDQGHALITANPFSHAVKRKKAKRDLKDEWLTAADVDELCRVAGSMFDGFGADAAAVIRFAAETGIRPGELYLLEEADLDAKAGELIIRRAADSKCRTIGPPKNGEARTITLSRRAAEAAASARRHSGTHGMNPPMFDARGRELPWSTKGTPRVFSSARGQQFWTGTWGHYWRQIRAAAGRPGMDFYELRHYCATRLLEAGATHDDVAVQLGHGDTRLVADVYGHPSKRQARERLRDLMDGEAA